VDQLRVAILGISGRMGRALITALDEDRSFALSGACASATSRWIGQDAGVAAGGPPRHVTVAANPVDALHGANVAIDFTLPIATAGNVQACSTAGCAMVIGTTGLADSARRQIDDASRAIPIVLAPNMSVGVNLLLGLAELAARSLDARYDIEIFEAHHRHKKDAPSGTALALGAAAARGRGTSLEVAAEYSRTGVSGPRTPGKIGFSVFRGGDVIGDHTVTFAGTGERIELTHRATDRLAFARGALHAARWLPGKAPGLYTMQDVLGLTAR
jgi:4-hydroxy-tetrahydrodipicolinate reductase